MTQAVILAGGLGTRLRPLTNTVPKCMALVAGKPFLYYVLSALRNNGIKEILACIGYLGESVTDCFGDGSSLGISLSYSQERDSLLGTGGALKLAESSLEEHFLVVNGDTYLDFVYDSLVRKFFADGTNALIAANNSVDAEPCDLEIDSCNGQAETDTQRRPTADFS
jgi:NDP-sugar pyrophosphorylase family protein